MQAALYRALLQTSVRVRRWSLRTRRQEDGGRGVRGSALRPRTDPDLRALVTCYPFLDHPAGCHPASTGGGGPCATGRFTSDIGTLLPIALCGLTSL